MKAMLMELEEKHPQSESIQAGSKFLFLKRKHDLCMVRFFKGTFMFNEMRMGIVLWKLRV